MKYTAYHCRVMWSGEASRVAHWMLTEEPIRKDRVGNSAEFAITLPVVG